MMKFLPLLAAGLALTSFSALAQEKTPVRIRGTVEALEGNTLKVITQAGAKQMITLASNAVVIQIVPSRLADIKSGTYVGTVSTPVGDGTRRALEVQVFPENMRGVGEGSRAWDTAPESTMTNGTVAGTAMTISGGGMTIRFGDREQKIIVGPDIPVVTYAPGTREMLKPGSHVLVNGVQAADGALSTERVNVGADGLTPPM